MSNVFKLSPGLLFAIAVLWADAVLAVPRDANHSDAAVMKLQAMVRSLSAERDAAKSENAGLASELEQVKKERSEASADKDALAGELAAQKSTSAALQSRLGNTESRLQAVADKYAQTSKAKNELEQQLTALKNTQQNTQQQLKTCGEHNVKLYQSAQELLNRYQNKGTFSGLLQDEPLLQFQSVDMQNIVQEYEDRLNSDKVASQVGE
jgi:chromosome segregation ATPase